jgi:hypothetical protein
LGACFASSFFLYFLKHCIEKKNFSTFSCCSKSSHQPQEDLAKSDYWTNREIKNLGILEHVKEPVKAAQILQKSRQFQNLFPQNVATILEIVQKDPLTMLLGLKQKSKMAALVTSLYHHLAIIPISLYPNVNKECYVALPFIQYKQ